MAKKLYGNLEIRSQQELRFFEAVAGGTQKVALKAAAAIGADFALTLPSVQASNDDVMKANSSGELSFGKIQTANISDSQVTYAKLSLDDGDIPQAKVTNLVSDLSGKLSTALNDANIFVGNSSNVATAVALTGDISIDNTGLSSIASGVIVNNDISSSAAIDFTKLAALSQGSLLIGNASNQPEALSIGSNGYVLKSNGTTASWQPDSGSSSVAVNWLDGDGVTKQVVHNLGSLDVIVQIYDKASGETIEVDSVVRSDTNTVDLTASEAPPSTDWRVIILKA